MPELPTTDKQVAVAGDWHGNTLWALKQLETMARHGITTCLHVGDFGLYRTPFWHRYLDTVDTAAAAHGITIAVTDGNHEDHAWRLELARKHGDAPAPVRDNIWLLPRGHRWTAGGRSFLSLGGAPSINFEGLNPGVSWWPEEMLSDNDILWAALNGHADIMLSHDAPAPAGRRVEHLRATNQAGWSATALEYAAAGAERITRAYDAVAPDILFHGHFHLAEASRRLSGQRIISLNRDGELGNVALLNLEDLSVTALFRQPDDPRAVSLFA